MRYSDEIWKSEWILYVCSRGKLSDFKRNQNHDGAGFAYLQMDDPVFPFYEIESGFLGRVGMGIGKAELQDSILGNEELPGFFQEVILGYKFMLHKDRLIELGLILGGRFLGVRI